MKSSKLPDSSAPDAMPWLLIDGNWLAYRSRAVLRDSWDRDATSLLVFSFLDQIRVLCTHDRCLSNRVALFFDSHTRIRAQVLPTYKQSRDKKTPEELRDREALRGQITHIRKRVLPYLGVPIHQVIGYEGDDLIASACGGLNANQKAIIVTSDGDLYQCITDRVHWFDPVRDRYHTRESFFHEKGIDPSRWWEVKCLAGCHGDCVPGVGGVGEKTAVKYLRGELKKDSKVVDKISRSRDVIDRNARLVLLPYEGTPMILLSPPCWSAGGLKSVIQGEDIKSFVYGGRARGWDAVISGKFSVEDRQRSRRRRI